METLLPESFYQQLRSSVLTKLSTDPGYFVSIVYKTSLIGYPISSPFFPTDDPTLCLITDIKNHPNPNLTLSKLAEQGKIGIIYLLSTQGSDYILKKTTFSPSISYKNGPETSLEALTNSDTAMQLCNFPTNLTDYNFIGCDEFTNETLIAYILEFIFNYYRLSSAGMNTFLKHHLGFICKSQGYNLMEYADLGTLNRIGTNPLWSNYRHSLLVNNKLIEVVYPDVILNIFKQVISTLHFLQTTVFFTSSDCKTANIFIKSDPITVNYNNLIINSPFTCKIGDYGKASLSINLTNKNLPHRIFNKEWRSSQYLSVAPFHPHINEIDGIPFYVISNLTMAQFYTRSRHMGIPYYLSFDTYTFIISFLHDPAVFHSFFNNDIFRLHLWPSLWFPDDIDNIFSRIHHNIIKHIPGSYTVIVELLMGIKLKCNLTSLLLDTLITVNTMFPISSTNLY